MPNLARAFIVVPCLIALGVSLPPAVQAADNADAWMEQAKEAVALTNRGIYSEAVTVLLHALPVAKEMGAVDPRVALTYHLLGFTYQQWGRCPESKAAYRQALALWDKAGWPEKKLAFATLTNVLDEYCACGESKAAERLFSARLEQIQRVASDLGMPYRVPDMEARIRVAAGRNAAAEALLKQALAILQQTRGPKRNEIATIDDELALVLARLGHTEEALDHARKSIAGFQAAGGTDPEYPTALNNLACAYVSLKRFDEAVAAFRQSVDAARRLSGDRSFEVFCILKNYTAALRKAHQNAAAAEAAVQAQEIYAQNVSAAGRTVDAEMLRLLGK